MSYSDKVPTLPGWYWRKDRDGESIMQVPLFGAWPKPWRDQRAETIAAVSDDPVMTGKLEAISPENWRVEWAGPIQKPQS